MKIQFPLTGLVSLAVTTLLFTGCATKPTLKGAYKHDFKIGVAINRSITTGTADQENSFFSRSQELVDKDIALVKEQFNQISPENDLKWASIHPYPTNRPGISAYNFGPADAYVNFGLSNHMYIVGHTLVWHAQTPAWVFAGTNVPPAVSNRSSPSLAATTNAPALPTATATNAIATNATGTNAMGTNALAGGRGGRGRGFGRGFGGFGGFGGFNMNNPHASREELLQRMHDHIATVVGRYKGKVKVWDVVNEAIADNGTNILRNSAWSQIIGPDFIAKAFEYAHEADPDAILRYNDYSLEDPAKRKKFITLIKSLQAQHVPVMAIGSQTHVSVSSPSFAQEDKALTELETLGLPIHITEFDVNGARGGQRTYGADVTNNTAMTSGGLITNASVRLANQYSNLFKVFMKHRQYVKVITLWGVNDAISWRANGRPLLFDGNDQPKPAFQAVLEAARSERECIFVGPPRERRRISIPLN